MGITPNSTVPWQQIVAVRVGKLTVKGFIGMYGDYPVTMDVPMMSITLTDGTHVLKDLEGVEYETGQIATAVAMFAPSVYFSEGAIRQA